MTGSKSTDKLQIIEDIISTFPKEKIAHAKEVEITWESFGWEDDAVIVPKLKIKF